MSILGSIMGAIFGQGSAAPLGQTVDVAAIVDKATAAKGEKLAWRTSIVDLMKALDLDSSLAARKQLANELKYTGDTNDSATMNVWLHKQIMGKLAANGGKLPADTKRMSALCHVWTAPSWQELSSRLQHWSVQPCVRPLSAAHEAAGHNALRGSGPNQKHLPLGSTSRPSASFIAIGRTFLGHFVLSIS